MRVMRVGHGVSYAKFKESGGFEMISLDNTKKLVRRVLNHTSKEAQVIITGGKSPNSRSYR